MREQSLEALTPLMRERFPSLHALYLFGSVAKGREHAQSDVDLALLADEKLAPLALFDAANAAAALVAREVDVVDLRSASTVFQSQVISTARLLWSRDDGARQAFEGRVYADYARLNEERREVLERIAREGRVHER